MNKYTLFAFVFSGAPIALMLSVGVLLRILSRGPKVRLIADLCLVATIGLTTCLLPYMLVFWASSIVLLQYDDCFRQGMTSEELQKVVQIKPYFTRGNLKMASAGAVLQEHYHFGKGVVADVYYDTGGRIMDWLIYLD
ncbi:MAG TPA: hypothetical protein PK395_13030 [bacterium]|nr:hypothetical protein [bacterium]HQP98015.1 hypothetical protein [bacterium]